MAESRAQKEVSLRWMDSSSPVLALSEQNANLVQSKIAGTEAGIDFFVLLRLFFSAAICVG
jgi:hypothetical protein